LLPRAGNPATLASVDTLAGCAESERAEDVLRAQRYTLNCEEPLYALFPLRRAQSVLRLADKYATSEQEAQSRATRSRLANRAHRRRQEAPVADLEPTRDYHRLAKRRCGDRTFAQCHVA